MSSARCDERDTRTCAPQKGEELHGLVAVAVELHELGVEDRCCRLERADVRGVRWGHFLNRLRSLELVRLTRDGMDVGFEHRAAAVMPLDVVLRGDSLLLQFDEGVGEHLVAFDPFLVRQVVSCLAQGREKRSRRALL